uniref:Uncharacterized protein n=1 Tax=Coccidioides posadasii RMSCC 3488 TaxID=454284 RepID=A0A0J6I574_COCPO|nr:hypothetical protein CPAG_02880 [Coccidioides posadasii RMSCC 3488]
MAYYPHNLPPCADEVDEIPWQFYSDIPLQLPSQPGPSFNQDQPVFQIWSPPKTHKCPVQTNPYSFPQASSDSPHGFPNPNAYQRNLAVSQPFERHSSRPSRSQVGISSLSPSPSPHHALVWDNGYGFQFGIDESVSGYTGSYPQDCDGVIAPWSALFPPTQNAPGPLPTWRGELEVFLLYRELNPDKGMESRTPKRWLTNISPPILIFQHWAVQLSELHVLPTFIRRQT